MLRLRIGAVAHGGHCVARHEGRVVFVRHCLPGEEVLARVVAGGEGDRFWRAEAVEVLVASPDRVASRCPVSGPGGCGGCDWQHASTAAQRRLKAAVVAEQVRRLAGLDVGGLEVEPVPGDDDGLGWRTRVRFAVDAQGRVGLRRFHSHEVVPVGSCPIAHPAVNETGVTRGNWRGVSAVNVVVGLADPAAPQRLMVVELGAESPPAPGRLNLPPVPGDVALARAEPGGLRRVTGRTWVGEAVTVDGVPRTFRVTGTGFWQVHPGAAQTLLDAVLEATDPAPGETALDLYSGVGLFTAGLAARVGPTGRVLALEGDARAGADSRRSLHDLPGVRLEQGRVESVLRRLRSTGDLTTAGVVVLDPPRSGAGSRVVEAVASLRPRVVAYVACDPAALARDVRTAAGLGYRLAGLRAFDTFPVTHHVECVARLVREPG